MSSVPMAAESRHLSVPVERPAAEVYAFVSDPTNLPRWAAGLGSTVEPADDGSWWVTDSPLGSVRVVFAPPNPFGVVDHDVELPGGEVVHNPVRVLPDGDGAEVVFTLRRRAGTTAEEFEADARAVLADLSTLRALLAP